jgi:hypothetical protein
MERQPCSSSTIAAIGYDAESRILEIEFRTGVVYNYLEVPPEIHAALIEAESCGRYLNANVKPHYQYVRV